MPALTGLSTADDALRRNPAERTSSGGWLKGVLNAPAAAFSEWPSGMASGGRWWPAVVSGGQRWSEVASGGQRWLTVPRGCEECEGEASWGKALVVRGAMAER